MESKIIYFVLLAVIAQASGLELSTPTVNPGNLAVQAKLQADFLTVKSGEAATYLGLKAGFDLIYVSIENLLQSLSVTGDIPDQSATIAEGRTNLTTAFRLAYDSIKKQIDVLKPKDAVVDDTNKNLAYVAIDRTVEILFGVLPSIRTNTNRTALQTELESVKEEVLPLARNVVNSFFDEIEAASSTRTEVVDAIEHVRRIAIADFDDIFGHLFTTINIVVEHDNAATEIPAVDNVEVIRVNKFRGTTLGKDFVVLISDLVRTLLVFSADNHIGDVVAFNETLYGYVNGGRSFVSGHNNILETVDKIILVGRNEDDWNSTQTEENKSETNHFFSTALEGFWLGVSTIYPADSSVELEEAAGLIAKSHEIIDLIWRAIGLAENRDTTMTEIEALHEQVNSKVESLISAMYRIISGAVGTNVSVLPSIVKAKEVVKAAVDTIVDEDFEAIKILLRQDQITTPDVCTKLKLVDEKISTLIALQNQATFEIIRNIRIFQSVNEVVPFSVIEGF